jgi:hypothetical protein
MMWGRILAALLPYSTPDGMRFPSEVLLVSGLHR